MSTQTDFILKIKDGAVSGQTKFGILASVSIAQAILESAWGSSAICKATNNLFGILANGWTSNIFKAGNGCTYRKYASWDDSISDHAQFIASNPRYKAIIGCKDYVITCNTLQSAGYAGNSSIYANALINLIKQYDLTQYDTQVPAPAAPQPAPQPVSSCVSAFPGSQFFGPGKVNNYILMLGQQLVKKGFGKHYKFGPSTSWGNADLLNVKDFQNAQGWSGTNADGIPGPVTWSKLFK